MPGETASADSAPPLTDDVRDIAEALARLDVDALHKEALRGRYINYLNWVDRAAGRSHRWYFALRLIAVTGGVLIPSLVGLSLKGDANHTISWLTFAIGVLVAVSVAIEGLYNFGDRWRHYRGGAERLKALGWGLVLLGGRYKGMTHATAVPVFFEDFEAAVSEEVTGYLAGPARPRKDDTPGGAPPATS